MFKKIALVGVALLAFAGCGVSNPASDQQYYNEQIITIDKQLPNGTPVRCFIINGYPQSLSCIASPTTR